MNLKGLWIGIISFFTIGIFHPIVIKCEYYFTERIWPVFLAFGVLFSVLSLCIKNTVLSAGSGVLGCTFFWCIGELKEQTRRVEKGWFPANPNRKQQKNRS